MLYRLRSLYRKVILFADSFDAPLKTVRRTIHVGANVGQHNTQDPSLRFETLRRQLIAAHIIGACRTNQPNLTCLGIKELLEREGTDKGKWYGELYDVLLQPHRLEIGCLVEIGIGTMIPGAPSSMVGWGSMESYRPGASLRAWRDFLPNAEVYGVDVAPDTQFTGESRIHTYLCDSTDTEQVMDLFARISPAIPNLIVDDGLHDVTAQIKTLKNFLPFLREGGLYVLEDIVPEHAPKIIAELPTIHRGCHSFVHSSSEPWVAIVIRKPLPAISARQGPSTRTNQGSTIRSTTLFKEELRLTPDPLLSLI
jgi:hypothetical protein